MTRKDIGFLLTALFCFIIWLMPISILGIFLPDNKVRLIGIEGNISEGQMSELLINHQGNWLSLGSMSWQLNPFSLAVLSASGSIKGGDAIVNYQGDFHLDTSNLKLTEFTLNFPAELIKKFAYIPANIAGNISVSLQELQLSRTTQWPNILEGQLTWLGAAAGIGGPAFNLGDYGLRLGMDQTKSKIQGQVQHLAGPLEANGDFSFSQARDIFVDVELAQAEGLNAQVWQTLQLVAKPKGEKLQLQYEMKL